MATRLTDSLLRRSTAPPPKHHASDEERQQHNPPATIAAGVSSWRRRSRDSLRGRGWSLRVRRCWVLIGGSWLSLGSEGGRFGARGCRYFGDRERSQSGCVGDSRYCQPALPLKFFECRLGARPHDAVNRTDVVAFHLQGTLYRPKLLLRILRLGGRQYSGVQRHMNQRHGAPHQGPPPQSAHQPDSCTPSHARPRISRLQACYINRIGPSICVGTFASACRCSARCVERKVSWADIVCVYEPLAPRCCPTCRPSSKAAFASKATAGWQSLARHSGASGAFVNMRYLSISANWRNQNNRHNVALIVILYV